MILFFRVLYRFLLFFILIIQSISFCLIGFLVLFPLSFFLKSIIKKINIYCCNYLKKRFEILKNETNLFMQENEPPTT